ncbi:anti-sigma factor [Terriglobus aquaticus]|uniref:Anti-sigma factor n=1 Tax=Terriglobus aquaticus TaxID=940139 RepID=A0ABW9KIG7_9BACT|nr:anti-sigma factor [Terriglobus aquaticus]
MNDDMLHPATARVPSSRLTCAQCERMIQDAIDGALLPDDQTQFDLHLAGCPGCSRVYADALEGLSFLEDLKSDPPEPSSLLLTRILAQTSGNPEVALPIRRGETILVGLPRNDYPAGHLATVLPFRQPERRKWHQRIVHAAMQPRFAMTAAMAFFSIALTMNLLGISPRDFRFSSLSPTSINHSFWAGKARVVRYYDNLRIVYELESRVNEMRQADDDRNAGKPAPAPAKQDPQPDPGAGNKSHSRLHAPRPQPEPREPLRPSAMLLPVQSLLPAASAAGNRGEGARV